MWLLKVLSERSILIIRDSTSLTMRSLCDILEKGNSVRTVRQGERVAMTSQETREEESPAENG